MFKIKNRTNFAQVIYAADGDSVQIQPQSFQYIEEKFLYQTPDPKIFQLDRSSFKKGDNK